MYESEHAAEAATADRFGKVPVTTETGRTENPVLMLGDALSAEKSATFRTTGNRFPILMIPAALMMEFLHY